MGPFYNIQINCDSYLWTIRAIYSTKTFKTLYIYIWNSYSLNRQETGIHVKILFLH